MSVGALQQKPSIAPLSAGHRGAMIGAATIGEAWIAVAELILRAGTPSDWEGLPLTEIELVTLDVTSPDPDDALIARHASPDWLAWMRANFTERERVAALGNARSYASRIFDYGGAGRDQLDWVVNKLGRDPVTSNVTVTTLEPLSDTSYIPCVSLLDFWLRPGGLDLVVYCHSIDFGKKGFANLVQLAELQRHVADRLAISTGRLTMIVKSAHIYETELAAMGDVVGAVRAGGA